jgi:hypothetical protein
MIQIPPFNKRIIEAFCMFTTSKNNLLMAFLSLSLITLFKHKIKYFRQTNASVLLFSFFNSIEDLLQLLEINDKMQMEISKTFVLCRGIQCFSLLQQGTSDALWFSKRHTGNNQ